MSSRHLSQFFKETIVLTSDVAVVILVPPDAPATILTSPFLSTNIEGAVEDMGLLPGTIKFAGDGDTPNALITLGVEKSSISLFHMIPVLVPRNLDPKLKQRRVWLTLLLGFNQLLKLLESHYILQMTGKHCPPCAIKQRVFYWKGAIQLMKIPHETGSDV